MKFEQFDEIYNSIVNGQFTQAFEQMEELDAVSDLADMLDYFAIDLDNKERAIDAAKIYFKRK